MSYYTLQWLAFTAFSRAQRAAEGSRKEAIFFRQGLFLRDLAEEAPDAPSASWEEELD